MNPQQMLATGPTKEQEERMLMAMKMLQNQQPAQETLGGIANGINQMANTYQMMKRYQGAQPTSGGKAPVPGIAHNPGR
jgi:hypothetical protein